MTLANTRGTSIVRDIKKLNLAIPIAMPMRMKPEEPNMFLGDLNFNHRKCS
jgi:hypothetical protein